MTSETPLTVVFDGTCGFCTRTVRLLREKDRHQRITWIPCQQLPASHPATAQCMESVIAITSDGQRDTGAMAAARIAERITGRSWPVSIATFPGVGTVLEIGYHLVARLRSHLPGDVPWCDQHPGECQPRDRNADLRDNAT